MDAKIIGQRLKKLRGSRSQAEVARAIGITQQAMWNYESGERIPKDDVKIKLANYYRTTVNKIFYS